jgi:hypothetical protein
LQQSSIFALENALNTFVNRAKPPRSDQSYQVTGADLNKAVDATKKLFEALIKELGK